MFDPRDPQHLMERQALGVLLQQPHRLDCWQLAAVKPCLFTVPEHREIVAHWAREDWSPEADALAAEIRSERLPTRLDPEGDVSSRYVNELFGRLVALYVIEEVA